MSMTLLNDSALDTLAKRIRTARLIAGLNQADVALACGVARSTVNEWEHGRSEPSASKMFAVARATGQALDWFAESAIDYRSEGWGFESLRAHSVLRQANGPDVESGPFWSPARSLALASLWCQVETDSEIADGAEVAR